MDSKILTSAFSTVASYITGSLLPSVENFIPVNVHLHLMDEADRIMATFYMQNAAFAVTIISGILTIYFVIKKNIGKNAEKANQPDKTS